MVSLASHPESLVPEFLLLTLPWAGFTVPFQLAFGLPVSFASALSPHRRCSWDWSLTPFVLIQIPVLCLVCTNCSFCPCCCPRHHLCSCAASHGAVSHLTSQSSLSLCILLRFKSPMREHPFDQGWLAFLEEAGWGVPSFCLLNGMEIPYLHQDGQH